MVIVILGFDVVCEGAQARVGVEAAKFVALVVVGEAQLQFIWIQLKKS